MGYFFVPNPKPNPNFIFGLFRSLWSLGSSKMCPRGGFRTHWFLFQLSMNICRQAKYQIFSNGGGLGDLAKNDKIFKSSFSLVFVPAVLKDSLETDFSAQIMSWQTINVLNLTPTLTLTSSLVYFFISGPLGVPNCVPKEVFEHTDSFAAFSMNICRESKNPIFSNGKVLAIWPKMTKFSRRHFHSLLSPPCRKTPLGLIFMHK